MSEDEGGKEEGKNRDLKGQIKYEYGKYIGRKEEGKREKRERERERYSKERKRDIVKREREV